MSAWAGRLKIMSPEYICILLRAVTINQILKQFVWEKKEHKKSQHTPTIHTSTTNNKKKPFP
mgnify:CR=1 FL=1